MSALKIGPRGIPHINAEGIEGVGSVTINFGEPIYIDVGDGDEIERKSGVLEVEIYGREYSFEANGSDDIQVAFYLMRIAGAWLMRVADEEGLILFHDNSQTIDDPMDIFEN